MFSQVSNLYNFQQAKSAHNEKMIFGIHGGGNIGLGLMADIISKSPIKYDIIATSNDQFLTSLVNNATHYALKHNTGETSTSRTLIKNVKIIPRDSSDVVQLYKSAKIMAICLTPVVITSVAEDIARGLLERYREDGSPLKILVVMNLPQCNQFVKEKVTQEMEKLIYKGEEINQVLSGIEFIPTVVDRIVTKIDEKEIKSHLRNQFLRSRSYDKMNPEEINAQFDIILSDREKFSEAVKKLNPEFNLFNAEENYALYVPKEFSEAKYFPTMTPINNLEQIETIKNKYINGPHAIIAWMGALLGCKTIAEAIRVPQIKRFVIEMMDEEIRPALVAEFPDLTPNELTCLRQLFIQRCMDSTGDPVTRVGRDPLRKLNTNGRIRGTIELYKKHNLKNSTTRLEQGVASAILYSVKGIDKNNPGCLQIRKLYKQSNYDYKAVLCYTGESPSGIFQGLKPDEDKALIERILTHIKFLETLHDTLKQKRQSSMVFIPPSTQTRERTIIYKNLHSTADMLSQLMQLQSTAKGCFFTPEPSSQSKMLESFSSKKSSPSIFIESEKNMNLQKKLYKMGLQLDNSNGHLSYSENFKPIHLDFELVFVRHGETYGNCGQTTADGKIDRSLVNSGKKDHRQRIFQGDVDTEINQLTAFGKKQALDAAKKLEVDLLENGWIPDVIFHSPLSRAKETGLPFVERNKFTSRYVPLDGIREMSFGAWDNRRVCDMNLDDPCHLFYKEQHTLVTRTGINGNGNFQKSENFCEVLIRAYKVLQDLNTHHSGKKILMFSHSMFGAACCILLGKGQLFENSNYLAFDGKKSDGKPYTIPNATPCYLHLKTLPQHSSERKFAMKF